jgi:ubiquinone/menaquinone biosynthesis C-methylase UbiE
MGRLSEKDFHEIDAKISLHHELYTKGASGFYNDFLKRKVLDYTKAKGWIKKKDLVLDVGVGDGPAVTLFNKYGFGSDLVGLDISLTRLKRNHVLKEKVCATGHLIPFKDNSFDCVLLNEVIEHSYYPEKMLIEIHRVLKRGGRLIMDFPNDLTQRVCRLFLLKFPLRFPGHVSIITPTKIHAWSQSKFVSVFEASIPFEQLPFFFNMNYLVVLEKI